MSGDDGEHLFELRFFASPDRLKLVRSLVLEAGRMCGMKAEAARDLVIAVDEACQNVIRHAYRGDSGGRIILECFRAEGSIVLKLRDFAPPVDAGKIKPRDVEDVRPGGLGTHFISELMDETSFLPPPDGGGNLLRMVKRIG